MQKIKIYLAGPDVFFPDAFQILENKKKLCQKYGFIGLSPFDNEIENYEPGSKETGTIIKLANHNLIRQADIVVANLNSFRGFEPDSGTCYECGYAEALGKIIYAYIENSNLSLIERYTINHHIDDNNSDELGNNFENFGFPVNLMLAGGNSIVKETFEECLQDINLKRILKK